MIDIYDGIHTWHVAKTGNNNNGGHSLADAKLTIGAAVSAAGSGDVIVVWPGDYDELVDLQSAGKVIHLKGISKSKTRIVRSSNANGVILNSGSSIENMSVISKNSYNLNCIAIKNYDTSTDIVIKDVYAEGGYAGLKSDSNIRLTIVDSIFIGSCVGANLVHNRQLNAVRCKFVTDGAYPAVDAYAASIGEVQVFTDCTFWATRIIENSTNYLAGVTGLGEDPVVMNNCSFKVWGILDFTGPTYGIRVSSEDTIIQLNGGCVRTINDGASTVLDIYIGQASSHCYSSGFGFNATKVSGNVHEFLRPTTFGRTLDIAATGEAGIDLSNIKQAAGPTTLTNITFTNLDLILKILKNKAVQNKTTGAIVIYDDDGVTPILTLTPTDSATEITRMQS